MGGMDNCESIDFLRTEANEKKNTFPSNFDVIHLMWSLSVTLEYLKQTLPVSMG